LAPVLYGEIFRRGVRKGHRVAESSWILEDNQAMILGVEKMGFRRSKTYRLYERALS
jgi:hypothetical protein